MSSPFRILVLGGSGVFGERFCRLLADDARFELIVAGRDAARAQQVAQRLCQSGARAAVSHAALDLAQDLDLSLAELRPHLVLHAAGPFQNQDYAVARACVRRGAHYLDLADGAQFVAGIAALDGEARAAGVLVASGASTGPALSSAVVDAVRPAFSRISRITLAISPGNRAPRGKALVEAILTTAGHRLPPDGGPRETFGWQGLRRLPMPGLGRRWLARIELPELILFRDRYGAAVIRTRAGLELAILHLGLWALSALPRIGLVRSLLPLARPLQAIADTLEPLGSDRGGMTMEIYGIGRNGRPLRRFWSLIAEAGEGPFVPVVPAAALARRLAAGSGPPAGAGPCMGMLSLADIEAELADNELAVCSGWGTPAAEHRPSLYRRVLGRRYAELCPAGQVLHDAGTSVWSGRCDIDGAETAIGRLAARLLGFPRSATDVPIAVHFRTMHGREIWERHFPDRVLRSSQSIGSGSWAGALVERFGPMAFRLGLRIEQQRLHLQMEGGRFLGMTLPRALLPRIDASESGDRARHTFHVEVAVPLLGRLVRYRGHLDVAAATKASAAAGTGAAGGPVEASGRTGLSTAGP